MNLARPIAIGFAILATMTIAVSAPSIAMTPTVEASRNFVVGATVVDTCTVDAANTTAANEKFCGGARAVDATVVTHPVISVVRDAKGAVVSMDVQF